MISTTIRKKLEELEKDGHLIPHGGVILVSPIILKRLLEKAWLLEHTTPDPELNSHAYSYQFKQFSFNVLPYEELSDTVIVIGTSPMGIVTSLSLLPFEDTNV